MAILNSQHLLEQATRLLEMKSALGTVRQVDRRRAISAAYYAVFHAILTATADEFAGTAARKTARYALVYRSIDHARLESLCKDVNRENLPDRLVAYAPANGFGPNIREFSALLVELKEKRISADYDPSHWIKIADAKQAIESARSAIDRFGKANPPRRKAFLTLLVFLPRR
jgi:hypothetical protein